MFATAPSALRAIIANDTLHVCVAVGCFWLTSILLTFYNKWIFTGYGFRFPLSFCIVTFATQLGSALSVRACSEVSRCCSTIYNLEKASARSTQTAQDEAVHTTSTTKYVVIIGLCSVIEIAGSNLSLLTLSVAFHTIVKSSTPIFVLIWAVIAGLQKPNLLLVTAIGLVTIGIVLAAGGGDASGEVEGVAFAWDGFLYVLAAANAGGMRWAACQKMLQSQDCSMKPVQLMIGTVTCSLVALPISSWLFEMPDVLHFIVDRGGWSYVSVVAGLAVCCGAVAFFLLLSELLLVQLTSSLTLSVAAVVKELLIVSISVAFAHEELTLLNVVGFSVCLLGVSLYKLERSRHMETMAAFDYQSVSNTDPLEVSLSDIPIESKSREE